MINSLCRVLHKLLVAQLFTELLLL